MNCSAKACTQAPCDEKSDVTPLPPRGAWKGDLAGSCAPSGPTTLEMGRGDKWERSRNAHWPVASVEVVLHAHYSILRPSKIEAKVVPPGA